MSEFVEVPSEQLFDDILHNPYGTGWHFGSGNPEYWRHCEQLVKPGGTVLDIGMEYARSSVFFALHGMEVTGMELRPQAVDMVNTMANVLGKIVPIEIQASVADAMTEDLGREQYDIVVLDHAFNHFESKEAALTLLDRAYAAVKPGGHIWVRAIGKEDGRFETMRDAAAWGQTEIVDDDVIAHPCGCSGEYQWDPTLFFGQTDLLQVFAHKGARIIHSQLMPQSGSANILYGEDFNPETPVELGGMVTILVQKP